MDFNNLRRRRDKDRPDCWHIYCGDIHAGTITVATGRPNAVTEWMWSAGFYPGSKAGEIRTGCSPTFESARASFERAWITFASTRTEADWQEWCGHRDWTAKKYALRDAGQPVPIR
jgi:hypothetical protein